MRNIFDKAKLIDHLNAAVPKQYDFKLEHRSMSSPFDSPQYNERDLILRNDTNVPDGLLSVFFGFDRTDVFGKLSIKRHVMGSRFYESLVLRTKDEQELATGLVLPRCMVKGYADYNGHAPHIKIVYYTLGRFGRKERRDLSEMLPKEWFIGDHIHDWFPR